MRTDSNKQSVSEFWKRSMTAGALLTAGCAALGGREPMPPNAIVLDVPAITQQEAHECGLASVAALSQYHGCSISPEVGAELRASAEQYGGLTGVEIRDALQASGLGTGIVSGTLDRAETGVYRQIDLGRPVLVMSDRQGDVLHASLLVGYDPDSGDVLHLDPVRGSVWESAEDFAAAWEPAGHFALIAAPAASLDAAEASLLRDLESVASADLGQRLAGELTISNNELTTVLLVLGIVLLVVILV